MPKTYVRAPPRGPRRDPRGLARGAGRSPPARRHRLVDVRETSEWDEGHIPGATHVSQELPRAADRGRRPGPRRRPSSCTAPAACGRCSRPRRSPQMGYTDVASMTGGFQAWKCQRPRRGRRRPSSPTEQKQRYSRHLLIPEVGAEGQAKLLDSKVLLIGAGGLGVAGGAVPRRGGRRHDRHRRLRRRRPVQPPAPGHPHHRPDRREEGRLGARRRSTRSTRT